MKEQGWHKAVLVIIRFITGAVFAFSGFAKAIDPWGTIYKIGEYLTAWDIDIPQTLVVTGSITLSSAELVLGSLLLLGCYRCASCWLLLLLMAFMLPLTAYIAIENPVHDCGCFGDLVKISNTATFWKNVALTVFLIILALYNRRIKGLFPPSVQWIAGGLLLAYALVIAIYGYNVQPLMDFRRFPIGSELLHEDEGETPEFVFTYQNDLGEKADFASDALPSDNSWHFVSRRLVKGEENQTDGFTIIDADGEDMAPNLIQPEGEQMIITIPDLSTMNLAHTYVIGEVAQKMRERGSDILVLVAGGDSAVSHYLDISMADYPVETAEPQLIKELVRGNPGMVYLKNGVIESKSAITPVLELVNDEKHLLEWLTLILAGGLGTLFLATRLQLIPKLHRLKTHKDGR